MRRFALVAALALSLVPPTGAAVLAASAVGGREAAEPAVERVRIAPAGRCAGLVSLYKSGLALNRRVGRATLAEGRPLPGIRTRAARLARRLRRHARSERPLRSTVRALGAQLAATRALARGPSAARVRRFNRAVAGVNETRPTLIGYC